MKRPVHWARPALDDLKELVAFIARENPAAAVRVADRIRDTCIALGEMAIGRPGRVTGTYEKPVTGLSYIISYELRQIAGQESVVILRVIHGARDWREGQWPQ